MFKELGVSKRLVQSLEEMKITKPTEIQEKAIPWLLEKGGDLVAQAQTGTGKTAAFGLPLLMKVDPGFDRIQGLIVAPTRELAKQIQKSLFRFTKNGPKTFAEVLCGGDPINKQVAQLKRPTHIIVATPGRLLELLEKKALNLKNVKWLVLDEADEMMSMGFKGEIDKILELTKERESTWLFSATFPKSIRELIDKAMGDTPKTIKVDKAHVVNRDIDHRYLVCDRDDKDDALNRFLKRSGRERGLVFARTKAGAITLCRKMQERGHAVDVLHGDLTQQERDKVMRAFKKERLRVLISTDVSARGIDVEGLSFVVHYQLPDQLEYYTHRSGRTARAGKKGTSVALITPRERKRLRSMAEELGISFREL